MHFGCDRKSVGSGGIVAPLQRGWGGTHQVLFPIVPPPWVLTVKSSFEMIDEIVYTFMGLWTIMLEQHRIYFERFSLKMQNHSMLMFMNPSLVSFIPCIPTRFPAVPLPLPELPLLQILSSRLGVPHQPGDCGRIGLFWTLKLGDTARRLK